MGQDIDRGADDMTWASGTRAALYVRKSTDREATRAGVEQQEQDGRYLCERNGCTDITLYSDNAKTAADPAKPRPEYERMMTDVGPGWSMSSWSRCPTGSTANRPSWSSSSPTPGPPG